MSVNDTDSGRSGSRVLPGRASSTPRESVAKAGAQRQLGEARLAFAVPRRQRNEARRGEGKALRRGVEALAIDEPPVLHRAGDQVEIGRRQPRPFGEDIALPIRHHGDHGGLRQDGLGAFGGGEPAMGFFVGGEALLMRDLDEAAPRPDASADQAEATAVLGVEPQHGVQQHAAADPLADLAEAAPPLGRGAEIEFAGVPRLRGGRLWMASTCRPRTAAAV
jgi:hypothetical protein